MDNRHLAEEVAQLHSQICSALADPRRILILYTLAERAHHVTELAEKIGISQPATSRHLKILRQHHLVQARREGTNVQYRLADPALIQALDMLRDVLHNRLSRGANLIEEASTHSTQR